MTTEDLIERLLSAEDRRGPFEVVFTKTETESVLRWAAVTWDDADENGRDGIEGTGETYGEALRKAAANFMDYIDGDGLWEE